MRPGKRAAGREEEPNGYASAQTPPGSMSAPWRGTLVTGCARSTTAPKTVLYVQRGYNAATSVRPCGYVVAT
jgi:hypothetical protein